MKAPAQFLADHWTERLSLRANTHEDTLKDLRQLALQQGWLTTVAVARSVEQALEMARDMFRSSGKGSHMSCLVTGSSYLVAEALGLLGVSKV